MQRPASFVSGVTNIGIYCATYAYNTAGAGQVAISGATPQSKDSLLVSGTLYCNAGTGLTSAGVVPVFLGPDGNWYPLAAASSPTAAGFVFNFQQTTPVPGLAIQVTVAAVGGTLFLAVIAAQL